MDYSTTGLIASIKLKGSLPTSQNLFTNADFVSLANDEMLTTVVPLVMDTNEEYFVQNYTATVVAGTSKYSLPTRAMGGKLRDVSILDSNNKTIPLILITREEMNRNGFDFGAYNSDTSQVSYYYMEGNKVCLFPTPATATTLQLSYFRRPGDLVLTSSAGKILSINTSTNEVTLNNANTSWAIGTEVDGVQGKPHFDNVFEGKLIINISGFVVTLDDVTGLVVGDWICSSGESPVPQLPAELHILVSQATTVKCLESMGDSVGLKNAQEKFNMLKKSLLTLVSPRVDSGVKKINNQTGLMAGANRGRFGN